jgi:ATP-dependent RNA helicase SUPV3L1/SUV3
VVGAPAKEVWLLGSPSARKAITVLAQRLGVPVEFHVLERKQPLTCAPKPLARSPREALKKVEARDCLVVFSRRDALQLRDDLLSLGHSVACVYGALTPEVRESEADRFASGAADVLVATDAIAMGLNLPIDRIIFTAVQKYDGTGRDDLPIALTQQIAGRAGRFGFTKSGVAAGITQDEHQLLQHHLAMKTPEVDSTQFSVAPTIKHLQEIAAVSGEERLASLLAMFVQHVKGGGIFISKVSGEQLERARWLDENTRLPLDAKYTFSLAPMNTREPEMLAVWQDWVRNVEAQGSAMVDYWKDDPLGASLAHGEFVTRMLAAYRWFARRFPALFVDAELAEQMVAPWSEAVERLLRSSIRQGGGFSGSAPRGLPGWYWRYRSGEEPEGNRNGSGRSRKRDIDDDV